MSEPLVIVGNGMAAARLVDELAKTSLGRYAIAVIGDEPRLAYNRVLLSSVLAGETTSHDIELRPANWWRDRGVTVKYGCRVTEVRDRCYFESIYFREPGGVLFEVATVDPGFLIDEPLASLGHDLKLPPWEEAYRQEIERGLPVVKMP